MWQKVLVWFAVADLISLVFLVVWWAIKGEIPERTPGARTKKPRSRARARMNARKAAIGSATAMHDEQQRLLLQNEHQRAHQQVIDENIRLVGQTGVAQQASALTDSSFQAQPPAQPPAGPSV